MTADDRLLDSSAVMARYGYKSRSSFWQFVHTKGVPHLQLNSRRILFDPEALKAWEAKRTIGKPSPR